MVTARVAFMPTSQSASERQRAASASASYCGAGRRRREARADRLLGQRRDPEPPHRQPAARELVDVAEDELALAAGVAGVHHLGEAPVAQQLAHHAQLIARARHRPQLERRRNHRQRVEPPRLPAGVVRGRLVELDEVADAPGDRRGPSPSQLCRPAPRTPSTRARSRATDGFSAMTSCMGGRAYRLSKHRGAPPPRQHPTDSKRPTCRPS